MISGMMGNTMSHGYLDVLEPLTTSNEARTAIHAFIDSANSNLQISELWEYETAYKAELSDINGARAFDLVADKFTDAVSPENGLFHDDERKLRPKPLQDDCLWEKPQSHTGSGYEYCSRFYKSKCCPRLRAWSTRDLSWLL